MANPKKAAAAPNTTVAVAAPAAPRTNAHGIGKAWQGPTSTTRMAAPVLVAYWAYLASVPAPNARQQRHLARCAKYAATVAMPANVAQAAAQVLAQYSAGNTAAQAALANLPIPAPAQA